MFELLFVLIEKLETGIGNGSMISLSKREGAIEIRVWWPDGFRLAHRVLRDELNAMEEEVWISYFIDYAKTAHPHLAPYIS